MLCPLNIVGEANAIIPMLQFVPTSFDDIEPEPPGIDGTVPDDIRFREDPYEKSL